MLAWRRVRWRDNRTRMPCAHAALSLLSVRVFAESNSSRLRTTRTASHATRNTWQRCSVKERTPTRVCVDIRPSLVLSPCRTTTSVRTRRTSETRGNSASREVREEAPANHRTTSRSNITSWNGQRQTRSSRRTVSQSGGESFR